LDSQPDNYPNSCKDYIRVLPVLFRGIKSLHIELKLSRTQSIKRQKKLIKPSSSTLLCT